MAKSYFYDEDIADWRELVKGEQGEQGERGPMGPQGPAIDIETGLPISVDTSVGTRVYVGDTMILGDTGWRELTVGFLATGRLRIRRMGNLVYMKLGEGNFSHLTLTSASAPAEQVIPIGFRPSGQEFAPVRFNRTKQIAGTISIQYNGWADPRMADDYTDISDTLQAGSTVWVTDQSWPSSLPGNPA